MYLGKNKKSPQKLLELLLRKEGIWKYHKVKVLFYDIETAPMKFWGWRPGRDQNIPHQHLDKAHNNYQIISIQWCWNDGKDGEFMHWGLGADIDNDAMITKFDALVRQADFVIGKNNKRFDDKHINAQRMLNQMPYEYTWMNNTDDLERQFRRFFNLPSQSLDYISAQLGLGGKVKMEMQDWINIVDLKKYRQIEASIGKLAAKSVSFVIFGRTHIEILKEGKISFDKMMFYGTKDVVDTRSIWVFAEAYIEPKFNMSSFLNKDLACKNIGCGSDNLIKNGTGVVGKVKYQYFFCNDCKRGAGKAPLRDLLTDYKRIV